MLTRKKSSQTFSNKIEKLTTEQSSRIKLIKENVLDVKNEPVDIVLAMNFSYWVFKERKLMIEYFKKVRNSNLFQ